jgi:nucleoside-diphosphate-sugar epimerase
MTNRVLVTGGRGLLGNAVIRESVSRGWEVVTLQRTPSGLDDGASVRDVLGSITDSEVVTAAIKGCDAVIHLAARVGIDGTRSDFERVNVGGTAVVLDAARRNDVSAFVHISSPSVAHAGEPLVGAVADPADPGNARGHYSRSKAMAEELVLGQDDVPVVALRPHLVWGPGDTQLVARIVDRARRGRLFLIDGGTALIDTTYIDNAASAICQGLARIDGVRGQALVVSNGEPRPVRDIIAAIVRAAGLSAPSRSVPFQPAWIAGAGAEAVGSARGAEPPLTRFLVEQLATAHWFDQRHTRAALNWKPTVGIDEGMALLQAWFRRGAEAGA